MDKKLPSISKFANNKVFSNNKDIYYSSFNKEIVNEDKKNTKTTTLDHMLKEDEYIFNIPVVIKTTDNTYKTTIIGKLGDHIITGNNKTIKIKDIVSIKMK